MRVVVMPFSNDPTVQAAIATIRRTRAAAASRDAQFEQWRMTFNTSLLQEIINVVNELNQTLRPEKLVIRVEHDLNEISICLFSLKDVQLARAINPNIIVEDYKPLNLSFSREHGVRVTGPMDEPNMPSFNDLDREGVLKMLLNYVVAAVKSFEAQS